MLKNVMQMHIGKLQQTQRFTTIHSDGQFKSHVYTGMSQYWYSRSLIYGSFPCRRRMMLVDGDGVVADLRMVSWDLWRRISRWADVTITLMLPCSRMSSLISEVKEEEVTTKICNKRLSSHRSGD